MWTFIPLWLHDASLPSHRSHRWSHVRGPKRLACCRLLAFYTGRYCDREVGVIKTNSAYWVECMKTELQVLELREKELCVLDCLKEEEYCEYVTKTGCKIRSWHIVTIRRVARSEAGIWPLWALNGKLKLKRPKEIELSEWSSSPSHHLCRDCKRTRLRSLLDTKMRRKLPL